MTASEKIDQIIGEYGQIHEEYCLLNSEGGSDDGCSCVVRTMAIEIYDATIDRCNEALREFHHNKQLN